MFVVIEFHSRVWRSGTLLWPPSVYLVKLKILAKSLLPVLQFTCDSDIKRYNYADVYIEEVTVVCIEKLWFAVNNNGCKLTVISYIAELW